MLRETRERIVARGKTWLIIKAWHSRERQALLFLIIKQKPQQPPCGHGGH